MRRLLLLVSIACTGLPAAAAAGSYSFSGSMDTGGGRTDTWVGDAHTRNPVWDFGAQLSLNVAPLRPDLLLLTASGNFRQFHSSYFDSTNRTDNYGYQASLGLFQRGPITLSASASRAWTDFNSTAAAAQAGSTLTSGQTVAATVFLERLPVVRASVSHIDSENHGLGGVVTAGSGTQLAVGASHSLENHSYSAGYNTSWNSGSHAEANYRTHYFDLQGTSFLSKEVEVRLTDRYTLRLPTVDSSLNPRFDDNGLSTSVSWRPTGASYSGSGSYGYHRTVVEVPGSPERESVSHDVGIGGEYRHSKELSYGGSVSAGFARDRVGADSTTGTGEAVGANVRWQRALTGGTLTLSGNVSTGLTQASGGNFAAYGAGAGAGYGTVLAGWGSSLSYSASWASNLLGKLGWSLSNQLNASASRSLVSGVSVGVQVTASDARQDGGALGGSSTQQALVSGNLLWSAHTLQASAGLSNSATPGGENAAALGLPKTLNTVSRFGTLTATTRLLRSLSLRGMARYLTTSAPGRDRTWEAALNGSLTYHVGLVDLSLEDRYSVGGTGDATQRVNLFLFRISRSFGANF